MPSRYEAMLKYLAKCPALQGIFSFQASHAKGNTVQILTESGEAQNNRKFIDGSIEKRFDFVVAFYKSVNTAGYVVDKGSANNNLEGLLDVQELIDWLEAQNRAGNYPDFGEGNQIDRVLSMNNEPLLAWIDGVHYSPPMAKYTVTVRVEYIDYTNSI